jgi:hypothetical protein
MQKFAVLGSKLTFAGLPYKAALLELERAPHD